MAYTRTEWNNLQKRLPPDERESYETYLIFNPPAPKKTPAPTSGVVPGFTPTVAMPEPKKQPGDAGFVGPVASTSTASRTDSAASVGLGTGVIAGVTGPATSISTSTPKGSSEEKPVWIKAGTVETLSGPVDVDASGQAQDGTTPIAKTPDIKTDIVEEKFEPVGKILRYVAGKTPGTRVPVYADGRGGEFMGEESNNPVNPGSSGFEDTGIITLASNTFANTLALLMGETEAGQPWVEELRQLTQGFINTGSDIAEATNLALREAKAKGKASKFVQRFDAIFKLQDRLNAGETVQVPTIADYVKSEQQLGDVLRDAGLGELATQEMAAKIFGDANKSVSEATALISDVFNTIDNAPAALKRDLEAVAPGADRTAIAKALLLGKEGVAALNKQIATTSVLSAAKSQGVTLDAGTAADYAARGFDYYETLATAGKVALGTKPFQKLSEISAGAAVKPEQAQGTMQQALFENNIAAQEKIRLESEKEAARFRGRAGTMGSRSLASRNRANRVI